MSEQSEDALKKTLGIDSWKQLSKDKMVHFAEMMPNLDEDTAIAAMAQFPDFRKFASTALPVLEQAHAATVRANDQSQAQVHETFKAAQKAIRASLKKDDLSEEQERYLIEKLIELAKMAADKDSENKQFLHAMFKQVGIGAIAVVAIGAAVLGVRTGPFNRA